ncbi:uncharacterized protein LOC122848757 isoform X3 [Aphidius gifuensis]|uniref:uncharacterized protein LOC122848757 isoform X3 n=1 Tax=Aphidius gifuensis TaxID=684658 RepID=UPI001CDD2112|nr:uncharacterized protein LOC122848757 isoform X3 [Aphidius gifuensis]
MNMETADLSPTEWLEKFIEISKKELELSKQSSDDDDNDENYEHDYEDFEYDNNRNHYDDNGDENDDEGEDENSKNLKAHYDSRMIRMAPLFISQPRLKKICKDLDNEFLNSCFTTYTFVCEENDSANELHEKANDLKYLINLCGINLTRLDVTHYPISQIMPIINANCPNLETLHSGFEEIMSQDLKNVFSNMSHLKTLSIEWQCENSTLPMTLAKSLEQIGGTLETLYLSCPFKGNDIFTPDSLASVFPQLIALNHLEISGFGLSQLLLQSIGKMEKLVDLKLYSYWPKNHPMFDARINMYPIGNLKNLERLHISSDYGVRDEFLINLCNNAKKLKYLQITGTSITDIGMSAINNSEELREFDLGLILEGPPSKKNEFITDESIQCLFNQKLYSLDISNCIKITDKGVIKLVENLPDLDLLFIKNTKVTRAAVKKIYELSKHRKNSMRVLHSILA